MIKSVTATNYLGESITLELGFPEKSGFLIQSITGLGPGKADINMSESATNDGSFYNSARVNSRNIVMDLKLLENPTIESTRQKSYKYFPIKRPITLTIEMDNRISEVKGYVESNEANVFSKDENVLISIICPDPYFYSTGYDGLKTTVFYGIEPEFSFPFSNDSLTEDLIIFGDIVRYKERNVYYSGDVEMGFTMYINAVGDVTNLNIYNYLTRETMRIDTDKLTLLTGSPIIAGDEIIISTIKGRKSILLLRNGIHTNILNCLDKTSSWFQLAKGDNVFAFTADEGDTNLQFRIENRFAYEGV